MKTVYFVRHGESIANIGHPVFLSEEDVTLTGKGHEQAAFIAERCKNIKAEALISSTATRAKQTAKYISKTTGLDLEIQALFTERIPPRELFGRSKEDPEAQKMHQEWILSFFQDNARVASGENFGDLKERVLKALEHLHGRPEEHILVATHGFFLHMVIALVLLGESLTAEEFNKVGPAVWMDNTGITKIEYRDQVFPRVDGERHVGWVLRVWNDHAHLG